MLNEKPETEEIKSGADFVFDGVKAENITFSYDGKTPVLNDFSLEVNKGEIVAIVGSSGCGKSTLLKLLLRFWSKDGGKIEYKNVSGGNNEIERINTSALLKNVTLVSQSTYLFNDTIGENLRIAKPAATDGELKEACEKASVYELIAALPQGFDTPVGELGGKLSSGERQRLGLARAFLRGSPLILLDEPTSNVDSINEGIILKALTNLRTGSVNFKPRLFCPKKPSFLANSATISCKNKSFYAEKILVSNRRYLCRASLTNSKITTNNGYMKGK